MKLWSITPTELHIYLTFAIVFTFLKEQNVKYELKKNINYRFKKVIVGSVPHTFK